ncbi:uncharacterized protein LOC132256065 [Phlebotomus argentipes]|uniref:uncharacterized protein LOC132256065 n=1 Tax=Phlebotomus argentipes TaxID=94469 RepID=UPI002892AE05|nr:uncharacterized protein LOC132256065 [Phlebotomus argentipes]
MEQKRNYSHLPDLEREGVFIKSLPQPPEADAKAWKEKLPPSKRVFFHQTLSSARHSAVFREFGNTPRDSLDMVLDSCYNHSDDLWHTKSQTHVQPETCGQTTFRRLRNSVDSPAPKSQPLSHPLCIGGITERISPHSVKLIHSGPHTPLTNPGYSRQTSDGNFFNY